MAKSDGASSSVPNPNPNPNPGPSSNPINMDRPPQLKKSRTISADAAPPQPDSPLFGGPLRPAVRRLTVDVDDPSDAPSVGGFLDRDWCYPSFLGGGAAYPSTRPRHAALRAARQALPPPAAAAKKRIELSSFSEDRRLPNRGKEEARGIQEKDARDREVVSASSNVRGNRARTGNSLVISVLAAFSLVSTSIAVFQRMRILELEAQLVSIVCNGNGFHSQHGKENFQIEDSSTFISFSSFDSRMVSLYAVLLSLVTPFILFKYLDRLPHIKTPIENSKNSEEEVLLKKRIAYRVDVFFSVYPYAKLLALLFATILLIGFGGLALYAVSDGTLLEALWLSWTFVADSGNHADRVGLGPRIVSVSISSGGMLIFAMMLGLVSDAISEKVDSWRKGKSEVIERNHILILGWSDKLGSLLKQLAIANKSLGGGVVVVLAERDKEEMEMDIAKLEFDFMGTSVICRSGSPLILADLKKVSVSKARAIIVLAADENADQSDARALRVVLSLTGVKEGLRGHVVVEMSDLDNEPLVKLVGGELIETVVAHDVIGRLMIQCALQPGLAQIWEDILGFENAEFYIKRWPHLDGMRFEEVLISFPDAVPCGVKIAANGGKIIINPEDDYIFKEGDEALVIAEDDDTYAPGPLPEVRMGFLPHVFSPPKYPEKILFCGWRRDIDDMIMVLEAFLAPGSELWMFNEVPEKERERKLTDGGLDILGLTNITLVHKEGNAVIRRHLESLPLETFDSILILADESAEDSIVHSDSRSLATLLLIRDIQGNEMCIRPAEYYLYEQEELSFYDIMVRGRERHEIVIGYRLANADRAVINPTPKMERRKWSIDDVFVVISLGE